MARRNWSPPPGQLPPAWPPPLPPPDITAPLDVPILPAPSPPPPFKFCLDCSNRAVSDSSILLSIYAGLVLGVVSIVGFSCLWKHVRVYTSRMSLEQVSFKPGMLPENTRWWTFERYWGWLRPVFRTTTRGVLATAGMDAVIMIRILEYGFQLFIPMAFVSMIVLLPIHHSGGALAESAARANEASGSSTTRTNLNIFMQLTIGNLPDGSNLMWVHFVMCYLFVGYGLWLLYFHYKGIARLTAEYNLSGEDYQRAKLALQMERESLSHRRMHVDKSRGSQSNLHLIDGRDHQYSSHQEGLPAQAAQLPASAFEFSQHAAEEGRAGVGGPLPPPSPAASVHFAPPLAPSRPGSVYAASHASATSPSHREGRGMLRTVTNAFKNFKSTIADPLKTRDGHSEGAFFELFRHDKQSRRGDDGQYSSRAGSVKASTALSGDLGAALAPPRARPAGSFTTESGRHSQLPRSGLGRSAGGAYSVADAGEETPSFDDSQGPRDGRRGRNAPAVSPALRTRSRQSETPSGMTLKQAAPELLGLSRPRASSGRPKHEAQPSFSDMADGVNLAAVDFGEMLISPGHADDIPTDGSISFPLAPHRSGAASPRRVGQRASDAAPWDAARRSASGAPPPAAGEAALGGEPAPNAARSRAGEPLGEGIRRTLVPNASDTPNRAPSDASSAAAPPLQPRANSAEADQAAARRGPQSDASVADRHHRRSTSSVLSPALAGRRASESTSSAHAPPARRGASLLGGSLDVDRASESGSYASRVEHPDAGPVGPGSVAVDVPWTNNGAAGKKALPRPPPLEVAHPNDRLSVGVTSLVDSGGDPGSHAPSQCYTKDATVLMVQRAFRGRETMDGAVLDRLPGSHDFLRQWWLPVAADDKTFGGVAPAEREHIWFDPRSELSRKPSVRYRKTCLIDDARAEDTSPPHEKWPIMVQNYCVLVTDVPAVSMRGLLEQGAEEGGLLDASKNRVEHRHVLDWLAGTFHLGRSPAAQQGDVQLASLDGKPKHGSGAKAKQANGHAAADGDPIISSHGRPCSESARGGDPSFALASGSDHGRHSFLELYAVAPSSASASAQPRVPSLMTMRVASQGGEVASPRGGLALRPLPRVPVHWQHNALAMSSGGRGYGEARDDLLRSPSADYWWHSADGSVDCGAAAEERCGRRAVFEGAGAAMASQEEPGSKESSSGEAVLPADADEAAWGRPPAAAQADHDGLRIGEAAWIRRETARNVQSAFQAVFPHAKPTVMPILNFQTVHLLLIKWDQAYVRLEHAELELEKRVKRGRKLVRPTHRTGWCGCLGRRVDSINYWKDRIKRLEAEIREEQVHVYNTSPSVSCFVFFQSATDATVAAQTVLHGGDSRRMRVQRAPGPDDVNWPALWKTRASRRWRMPVTLVMYILIMAVPLGVFAGALTGLKGTLCDLADPTGDPAQQSGYSRWVCSPESFGEKIITQLLPAILVIVWQNAVMPLTLYSIAQVEAAYFSLSSLDCHILFLFFYWNVFNIFLGGLIAGSLSSQLNNMIQNPSQIPTILGVSMPSSSNFFLNYLSIRALGLVPFRMILPHGGIWRWLFKCGGKLRIMTKREEAGTWAPASIRYGREIGVMTLIFVMAWAYAVVSPVVVCLAAVYFMISWLVWKWQVLFICVRTYEGGGKMWRSLVQTMIYCMLIFVFFSCCVFTAKRAYWQASALFVTLPLFIWRYGVYLRDRFDSALKWIPLEQAIQKPVVDVNPHIQQTLEVMYTPSPLRPGCAGWHPEWGKVWEGWGCSSYTAFDRPIRRRRKG